MTRRLRAVLVEDSAVQARMLRRVLEADNDIEVVACAASPSEALAEVVRHEPDVVTMDLELPAGGGQGAIEQIMAEVPTPILVLSGHVDSDGGRQAVAALAAGAVDALPKPGRWTAEAGSDLRRMTRRVASVPVIRRRAQARARPQERARRRRGGSPVVGVAASTGGPAALTSVLSGLDGLAAPVLVVQHIHETLAPGFAGWLQDASGRDVVLAENGQPVEPGVVYVAPGAVHLRLGPKRRLLLGEDPPSLHRPSADELFASMAREAGPDGIGVILTGMGEDGARGLAALRAAGGVVLGQDRETSAVFGMPQAAQRAGATTRLLPLGEIPAAVVAAVEAMS